MAGRRNCQYLYADGENLQRVTLGFRALLPVPPYRVGRAIPAVPKSTCPAPATAPRMSGHPPPATRRPQFFSAVRDLVRESRDWPNPLSSDPRIAQSSDEYRLVRLQGGKSNLVLAWRRFATCPAISLRMCIARFPMVVWKRIVRSTVSADVFAPPTTSTSGNQVRRIKRMSGYGTLRVLALGLDAAHRDTGCARRQDGRRWKDRVDVREQFDLKSLAFRAFSCTMSAPSSAASRLDSKRRREVDAPGASPSFVSAGHAACTWWRTLSLASGAGSVATTSSP
jgi:hypothetical protein